MSKSYAYKIVQRFNKELKAMGYLTVAGRMSTQYFEEKACYHGMKGEKSQNGSYKEKDGSWRVIYCYTDWKGERKQTSKRGFVTSR